MLIIEGSDNLGKTTAAQTIVKLAADHAKKVLDKGGRRDRELAFPVRYQHMSRQNEGFDYFYDYGDMISKWAVQDRFHLGAFAYHDPCPIPMPALRRIEGWLRSVGSYIAVVICRDRDWYRDRLETADRYEMFTVDQLVKANDRFIEIVDSKDFIIDFVFEVNPEDRKVFMTSNTLKNIMYEWFERLAYVPRY